YHADLAEAVNALITDPTRAQRYGDAGRRRCEEVFSWARVAEQTLAVYRQAGR
ncbi:glycosyltransferase, partial [Mycolicibacter sp. MYC340]